ncbi:MAG: 2-dehydro-3-deoxy-6-phosphogalactonate aldolase [Rhodobacteraceae bacterium]|nr:MAG: 2-dehydro-3-deoxy-6-phosphogalactonate aldolase [Paracoccaceae bacterium]
MDVKIIAILRGITPDETPDMVRGLLAAGVRAIEIPLNSPDPLTSIKRAAEIARAHGPCLIGAGTVLEPGQVAEIRSVGGTLVVSPDVNEAVVRATVQAGMASFPGVFTATEAHRAIRLGATGLKFFPAALIGPGGIAAIRATLPATVDICVVGGVGAADFAGYRQSGVTGYGLGTNLYRPGDSASEVAERASEAVDAFRAAYPA